MTKTYWFIDRESGEDFLVEALTASEARVIANTYFEAPRMVAQDLTFEQAEYLGFDTY